MFSSSIKELFTEYGGAFLEPQSLDFIWETVEEPRSLFNLTHTGFAEFEKIDAESNLLNADSLPGGLFSFNSHQNEITFNNSEIHKVESSELSSIFSTLYHLPQNRSSML